MASSRLLSLLGRSVVLDDSDDVIDEYALAALEPLLMTGEEELPERWSTWRLCLRGVDDGGTTECRPLTMAVDVASAPANMVFRLPSGGRFRCDGAARRAELLGYQGGVAGMTDLIVSLDLLWAGDGLYPLHAAAFVDEVLGCVVVTGPSGSGKSTTLAAFLDAGARFVADDRLVVAADEPLRVAGLFGLRKRWVDGGEWYGAEHVERTFVRRGVVPAVVLLVEVVSPAPSATVPVDDPWIRMAALLPQTGLAPGSRGRAEQVATFRRLADLPTFGLHLGCDCQGAPDVVVHTCRRLLDRSDERRLGKGTKVVHST